MLAKKPKGATEKRNASSVSGLLWMFVGAVLTLMIGVFLYLSPLFDFNPSDKTVTDPNKQVQPRVNTDTDNVDYEFYDILPTQEMATIPDEALGEASANEPSSNPAFEPDVVITQPDNTMGNRNNNTSAAATDNPTSEPNRGSADTNSNNSNSSSNNDDIVIVEENDTYDGTIPNSNVASNPSSSKPTAGTANVQRAPDSATYILQINSFGNADEADRRRAQVLMAGVDAKVIKNTTNNGATIYQVISRPMNNRQAVTTAQQRLQNNGIDSIIVEQRR